MRCKKHFKTEREKVRDESHFLQKGLFTAYEND